MSPGAYREISTSTLIQDNVDRNILDNAPSISANGNGHLHGRKAGLAPAETAGRLAELDASRLEVNLTKSPQPVPEWGAAERALQTICTDHMITCQWTSSQGWAAPKLEPYGPLAIMPSANCLHYATQCFEGLKLYRGRDGKLRLFRPDLNADRFLMSATRIALPAFNPKEMLALMVALSATDGRRWLKDPGTFLYMRPLMIGNDPALGVKKPNEALLCIMLPCFLRMDHGRFSNGLRLLASKEDEVRAWPGGYGYAKVGANYGPTLAGQAEALGRSYDQILWLFGPEGEITEAGPSNIFFVIRSETGALQMITPPIESRLILDGITRRSAIQLTRERIRDVEVVERPINIGEVATAFDEGRLLEVFVTGTAYFVVGVEEITWDKAIRLPVGDSNCGEYAGRIKRWMEEIMYGEVDHEWGYVIDEKDD